MGMYVLTSLEQKYLVCALEIRFGGMTRRVARNTARGRMSPMLIYRLAVANNKLIGIYCKLFKKLRLQNDKYTLTNEY